VIPAPFEYVRAESADAALAALLEHGDEAKLLAGGMSLLPLMKLRLATPAVLVDVGRLRELSYIRAAGDHVAIGALTRHRDVEISDLLGAECAPLRAVAAEVGDNQVRHRGTLGGSVAHGDPASDLPAALLALDATFSVRGPAGEREIAAGDFFHGFLETALAPDELLTEVRVPKVPGARFSYEKFNRRAQDWAIVGVAAARTAAGTGVALVNMGSTPVRAAAVEAALAVRNGDARVALVNMGGTPLRARGVEEALAAGSTVADAAEHAAEGTEAPGDLNATPEFRDHLARVLVRRALEASA